MSPSTRRARQRATAHHSARGTTATTEVSPPSQVSSRRLWLFRLTSVFLAPLLLLTGLELALRSGHYGYPTGFFVQPDDSSIRVTNDRFGWRFFGPHLARLPEPQLLSAKPHDTIRIFVLGGSAAMGVPNPHFSFGRILEVMLRERHPGVRFEVVNAAMTAINSYVVLEIARDCAALQPDLFIVSMGNNEVVGPYGPGAVFQDWSPNLPLIRATLRVRSTRTGQLLGSAMAAAFRRDRRPKTWRGMAMAMNNPVAADDPRLTPTYANFRRNLADICRVAGHAGAAVVLATVPVNLRDCPPFASRHRAHLPDSDLQSWQSIYRAGIAFEERRQWREALVRYELAARLDDRFAELEFRMGECLAALGRHREARDRFLAARDLDVLRFRADGKINQTVREVAAERRAGGVFLADGESAVAEGAAGDVPGGALFFEHVHLTFDGNYLLARALLDQVERALPQLAASRRTSTVLSRQQCAHALAMTPWDEQQSFELMAEMTSAPPFTGQLGHAARLAAMKQRAHSLATPSSLPESRRLYEWALESAPGDWSLHHRYGQLLLAIGEPEQAARHMQVALEAFPWNLPLHVDLAKAKSVSGHNQEAIALFEKALEMYPIHPAARAGLVAALAREGRLEEAMVEVQKAVEIDPTFDGAYLAFGVALGERGDAYGAMAQFRKALEINPQDALAHQNLGTTLAERGRVDEAIASLRKAVEIDPSFQAAHMNLGLALARRGSVQEAMGHFQAVLKITPEDPIARYALGSALASQGHTDEAIAAFRKVIAVDPRHYGAHVSLGIELAHQGHAQEAIASFQKAREIAPRNPAAYYNLGTALAAQGRAAEATTWFQQALATDPTYVAAHLGLGSLAAEQGRVDEALVHTQRALELDPGNATAYYLAGQLLARYGRADQAVAAYRQALAIRPDFEDARRNLQSLSRAHRGPSQAVRERNAEP